MHTILPGESDRVAREAQHREALGSQVVRPAERPRGRLLPLLPTPRIAMRLVNVYRVIKATKSADELEAFEGGGRAQACLLMLAILFGRPTIAGPLLRALHERKTPFDDPDERFVAALRKRSGLQGESPAIQSTWESLALTLEGIGFAEKVEHCAREAKEVARYSLVSGHDWHTWIVPPKPVATGDAAFV